MERRRIKEELNLSSHHHAGNSGCSELVPIPRLPSFDLLGCCHQEQKRQLKFKAGKPAGSLTGGRRVKLTRRRHGNLCQRQTGGSQWHRTTGLKAWNVWERPRVPQSTIQTSAAVPVHRQ